jgi:hypothetical protein
MKWKIICHFSSLEHIIISNKDHQGKKVHLPLFESPVAYESIATRGVMPNAAAVSAEATAIAASSSLDGSELIAQSP